MRATIWIRYFVLYLLAFYLSSFFSLTLTRNYQRFFFTGGGFDINLSELAIGYPLAIELLLPFLLIFFGRRENKNVVIVTVTLLLLVGLSLDVQHFYIPLVFVVVGIGLGLFCRFIVANTLGKISALEPMKKYF